ncbi:hypothetical protein NVS89_03235 [Ancylobacter sp. MQZ15Z-1]|uniref:Uncharacterized protein n=1 Tax=Ancylobacter mangrovi TaxID=2972472 RepID=A0A9X2P898_9HYPH|nr:hypothetical protein [Ancylobacter mangrovi]MCS0494097.1 hypothetical protein [Ancylobacter mangrovi]
MRATFPAFLLSVVLAITSSPGAHAQSAPRIELRAGGLNHCCDLYVPPGRGGFTSPDVIRRVSGYQSLPWREGFMDGIMIGTGNFGAEQPVWNAGGGCASAMHNNANERAHVHAA